MSSQNAETCAVVKPGWKTTEFWVSVLTAAGAMITGAVGVIPPKYAVLAAAASAGFYSVSRGLSKTPAPAGSTTIITAEAPAAAGRIAPLIALLMFPAFLFSGCAATQQQMIAAGVQAIGEAYGSAVLTQNPSAKYLANYKILVPKIAGVMQGKMTPADFHLLMIQIKGKVALNAKQAAAIGFLSSISDSFVRQNGGAAPTVDGALADAEAKQLAAGLAEAVGLVTGTNWQMPQ